MKKKRCGGRLERSRGRNDWFIPTVFRFPSRCQINFFVGLAHLQVFLCPALLSVPSNLISIWFSLQQQQQRRANKEGAYSRSMARGIQRMGICTQRRGGRALGALSRPYFSLKWTLMMIRRRRQCRPAIDTNIQWEGAASNSQLVYDFTSRRYRRCSSFFIEYGDDPADDVFFFSSKTSD